jgi:hypothetical protein
MSIRPEQRAKYMDAISNYIADNSINFTEKLNWQALLFLLAMCYFLSTIFIYSRNSQ